MGRRAKIRKQISKHLMLPEDLVAKVDLELWSDLEGKVPFGQWQKLVTGLLEEWVERKGREGIKYSELGFPFNGMDSLGERG